MTILSLVTGTLDRRESFHMMLESIQKNTSVPWELIVSDASEKPYLDVMPLNVKVLLERPRLGFSKGYNKAFNHCQGKWVIWLNDDAEVMPGYDKAIEFMERNPYMGLGCLKYSDPTHEGFRTNEHWGMPYANFGIISRELGNKIGWFDEAVKMYGSDNSITFRVLMAGKGVAVVPVDAIRHHRENDAHRTANNLRTERLAEAEIMTKKYSPYLQAMRHNYAAMKRNLKP